jgi:hypothetical protein
LICACARAQYAEWLPLCGLAYYAGYTKVAFLMGA